MSVVGTEGMWGESLKWSDEVHPVLAVEFMLHSGQLQGVRKRHGQGVLKGSAEAKKLSSSANFVQLVAAALEIRSRNLYADH
jgi:hypothetical protein